MWFLIGIAIGAAVLGIVALLRTKKIALTWYEWVLGIIGMGLLLFTLQNFFGSFAELESKAAYVFLIIPGIPAVIMLALAWQLAARRQSKSA
ncbi:hypothetical protein [Dehalococcoides mccartyi]|uniref:Reductive dehalogenase anchoring protein n=1 Tax=Dehalococcoides mccartyi (strain VS) TaxID=311424 RepID=D2BG21_DEHMV|nr:hypothetical protein [Dehalococcoides mccartyi]ACZ61271.1 reductive dehalogenase anchoring protein [Dehalococcoides mccartyi VS]